MGRHWVYYTWTTESFGPTNQDEHVDYLINGEADVSSTTRTLLRTIASGHLRTWNEGLSSVPLGFVPQESIYGESNPFAYIYTYAHDRSGESPNPSILTARNPDWLPSVGVSTIAPVMFGGLTPGVPVFVPPLPDDGSIRDAGWVNVWTWEATAGDSKGQRRADPGQSLHTRLQFWSPAWDNQTVNLGGTFHMTVAQLVEVA
jgi:hypothetical protein